MRLNDYEEKRAYTEAGGGWNGIDACISYETDIENWSMQDLQDFKTLFGGEE